MKGGTGGHCCHVDHTFSQDWILQTVRSLQLEVAVLKAAVLAAQTKNNDTTLSLPSWENLDSRRQPTGQQITGWTKWTVHERDALKNYQRVLMGDRKWWAASAKCKFEFRNENIVNASEEIICHLVGGDMNNSKGAALALAEKFGHPGAGKLQIGEIRIQQVPEHEIWHLVSKPWAKQQKFSNPGAFYLNHLAALVAMKDKMKERGVARIAITPLGNNCNKISWEYTETKLTEIFADMQVTFVVYCSRPKFSGVGGVAAEGAQSKAAHRRIESRTECLPVATGLARGGCPQQPPTTYHPPGKPTPKRYEHNAKVRTQNSFSTLVQNDVHHEHETERVYAEEYLKSLKDDHVNEKGKQKRSPSDRLMRDLERRREKLGQLDEEYQGGINGLGSAIKAAHDTVAPPDGSARATERVCAAAGTPASFLTLAPIPAEAKKGDIFAINSPDMLDAADEALISQSKKGGSVKAFIKKLTDLTQEANDISMRTEEKERIVAEGRTKDKQVSLSKSLSGGGGKSQPPSPNAEHSQEPPQTNLLPEVNSEVLCEANSSNFILHAPAEFVTSTLVEAQSEMIVSQKDDPDGETRKDEHHKGCIAGGGSPYQLPPPDLRSDHKPPRQAPSPGVGFDEKLTPESSNLLSPEIPDVLTIQQQVTVQQQMIDEVREMRRSLDKFMAQKDPQSNPSKSSPAGVTRRRQKNQLSQGREKWR
ncbi:uncharacterized protein LOC132195120 isoform X2 [Neocloeon triangulifer]|uniref:uncharacterized protein LOC132195120 isoform X2 n=1 Tax=Neocloeon triangulifer TaxID=2078957 RepID=UPI00286F8E3F|nr:uncharacterized protein LOC132195120 isoform X2 [Neocloeon triangulifer]